MADNTRSSFNAPQKYRKVVAQQGRVTLDADWNEAQTLLAEETRADSLDFVGPWGSPNNGYAPVTGSTAVAEYDFTLNAGTMYVGGVRVNFDQPVQYSKQSDWIDSSADPLYLDPTKPADSTLKNEQIVLLLTEDEVSAVEDPALKEVALGGPDTAQRTRIVQHILRRGTNATDCPTAWTEEVTALQSQGVAVDPISMRLTPYCGLQVTPGAGVTPSVCQPDGSGGYLGADNQMIRVQISAYDPTTKNFQFVWGFDNASFLYKANFVSTSATGPVIQLQSTPVDDAHQPANGQAVEILTSGTQLHSGDYTASLHGFIGQTASYAATPNQITLQPATLPAQYTSAAQTPPLFVRIWQAQIPFTPGTAVSLDPPGTNNPTGLQITLSTPNGEPFRVGDYWYFSVRPSTPSAVYPSRYLSAPQPPEGPRQWACPLSIINWTSGVLSVVADCRNSFANLVALSNRKLNGCCTVIVSPQDITPQNTLQNIIDKFQSPAQVSVCLLPGQYTLTQPLNLGANHSNIVLESCQEGAVLAADPGSLNAFLHGMVILNQANNVTLSGLTFQMPSTSFSTAGGTFAGLSLANADTAFGVHLDQMTTSIAIRSLGCTGLTVDNCIFNFPPTTNEIFAVGVYTQGVTSGLTLRGNVFTGVQPTAVASTVTSAAAVAGFIVQTGLLISSSIKSTVDSATAFSATSNPASQVVLSSLDNATLKENVFTDLASAAMIFSDSGAVRINNNVVTLCGLGIAVISARALDSTAYASYLPATLTNNDVSKSLQTAASAVAAHPIIQTGSVLARGYPLPPGVTLPEVFLNVQATIDNTVGIGYLTDFVNSGVLSRAVEADVASTVATVAAPAPAASAPAPAVAAPAAAVEVAAAPAAATATLATAVPRLAVETAVVNPTLALSATPAAAVAAIPVATAPPVVAAAPVAAAPVVATEQLSTASIGAFSSTLQLQSVTSVSRIDGAFGALGLGNLGSTVASTSPTAGLAGFALAHYLLSDLDLDALNQQANGQATIQLVLAVENNQIDALTPAGTPGPGLVVWTHPQDIGSICVATSNTIRTLSALPAAIVYMVEIATISNNVIMNADSSPTGLNGVSLDLIPNLLYRTGSVAIVANVFMGTANLPARVLTNVPAPMNTWGFLNTQIQA